MLVPLVVAVTALAVAGPASAAGPLTMSTGGYDIAWSVTATSSGTYAITLAAKSRTSRTVITRVGRVTAAGIVPGPSLPVTSDGDLVSSPSEDGSTLCVGTSSKHSPYVGCLEDGGWVERRFTGAARTKQLIDIDRYGSSLYAFLLDGDVGALNGKHPERIKLSASMVRWDGTAWVAVVAAYELSLKHLSQPLACFPLAGLVCADPLLATSSLTSNHVGVRRLDGSAWAADTRGFALRKRDYTLGPVVGIGARLAVLVEAFSGRRATLFVVTDSGAPKRIKVATLTNAYTDAYLTTAAGRSWVTWVDYGYADKKETHGDEVVHTATVDLVAGTVGPATEVQSRRFKGGPGRTDVVDVEGLPFASFIKPGKADVLTLSPLPAP